MISYRRSVPGYGWRVPVLSIDAGRFTVAFGVVDWVRLRVRFPELLFKIVANATDRAAQSSWQSVKDGGGVWLLLASMADSRLSQVSWRCEDDGCKQVQK